jgi:ubiquinone/menaquinone biosynthesis C-methylase UbiE
MAECVCPWWLGYLLASPIRKLWQKPDAIVAPYIKDSMTVLEVGPGMGFFTIPMARIVGERGKIVCVDIQEKMLKSLMNRAKRAGVAGQVITKIASRDSLNIADFAGKIDFVLAFAVVHEIPDQENLFRQIFASMKPGALLLVSEPTGHVTNEAFEKMLSLIKSLGFEEISRPIIKQEISAVLKKGI